MRFDDVFEHIGEFGRYQVRYIIFVPNTVALIMYYYGTTSLWSLVLAYHVPKKCVGCFGIYTLAGVACEEIHVDRELI